MFIGNVDRLEKRITRAYRRTLFGSLSNVWLFDRRCVKPDKANASALALLPRDSAHRLAIDVPALTLALGSLIRSDVLNAYPYPAKIWTPEAVAA